MNSKFKTPPRLRKITVFTVGGAGDPMFLSGTDKKEKLNGPSLLRYFPYSLRPLYPLDWPAVMAKSRDGGVWREALTAGLVTAIITAFELYANVWKLEWVIEKPNWSWALVLVLAFAAAFFLVWLINKLLDLLQAKKRRQPMELESIGKVNGYWIDAIRDHPDQKPIQVSIFELSSTQHNGFSANGTSYPANDGYEEFGAFKTTQSHSMRNGFIYFFEGE